MEMREGFGRVGGEVKRLGGRPATAAWVRVISSSRSKIGVEKSGSGRKERIYIRSTSPSSQQHVARLFQAIHTLRFFKTV